MKSAGILISGYYGFANAGDEAILSVILSKLRARCPDARITVISGNPASTAADHGVETILWSDPRAIAGAVRAASLVIVGGGGLFHDYSGFIPDGLFTEGNWGLGFHVTAAMMAALFSKPLMLYAVGVGPLFSGHGHTYTRAAAEAASAISVRDESSAALLRQIGVRQVRVSADPAFCFEPAPPHRTREIWEAESLNPDARRIAVVARHWEFGVHPVFWQEQLAVGLDRLLDQSQLLGIDEVVFVPFQKLDGQNEDDVAVSNRIHAAMRYSHSGESRVLKGSYTPAELCGLLQSCRMVVGMRLHSLIFAASGGVPVVSISYDPKVGEVMRSAGLDSTVLSLGNLTADALVSRAVDVLKGWSARTGDLEASLARLREAVDCDASIAADLLREQPPAPPLTPEVVQMLRTAVVSQLKAYERLKRSSDLQIRELTAREAELEAQVLLNEERVLALQKRASRLAPLETEAHEVKSRISALQTQLEEQANLLAQRQAEVETMRACINRLRPENDALRTQLAESADRWRQIDQDFRNYRARLRQWQIEHRNQRAWQVMLVVRKGYTLAFQRGWKGRARFLAWLPGLLAGRTGDLSEYDLHWEDDG